jgi:hypothetical protein
MLIVFMKMFSLCSENHRKHAKYTVWTEGEVFNVTVGGETGKFAL